MDIFFVRHVGTHTGMKRLSLQTAKIDGNLLECGPAVYDKGTYPSSPWYWWQNLKGNGLSRG